MGELFENPSQEQHQPTSTTMVRTFFRIYLTEVSSAMTYYELWDMKSRNAIGGFESQAEALSAVRSLIADHGRAYIDDLFLGAEDEAGNSVPVAKGHDLARLAQRVLNGREAGDLLAAK